jgi:hypothetical protein
MPNPKKRKSSKGPPPQANKPCITYREQLAQGFSRGLGRLGAQAAAEIPAELEDFMKDIRDRVALAELQSRWGYKLLQTRDARRAAVYQIRVCTHYRVALIRSESVCQVFFLNAYRRTGNNSADIDVAVDRALEIRRGLNEL